MPDQRIELNHQMLHDGFVVEVQEKIELLLQDPAAIEQLRLLWQQAPVMVFRRQSIEEHEQVQFSQQFGACEVIARKDILSPYHDEIDRKSTRLNSSHVKISYAVLCLKK